MWTRSRSLNRSAVKFSPSLSPQSLFSRCRHPLSSPRGARYTFSLLPCRYTGHGIATKFIFGLSWYIERPCCHRINSKKGSSTCDPSRMTSMEQQQNYISATIIGYSTRTVIASNNFANIVPWVSRRNFPTNGNETWNDEWRLRITSLERWGVSDNEWRWDWVTW